MNDPQLPPPKMSDEARVQHGDAVYQNMTLDRLAAALEKQNAILLRPYEPKPAYHFQAILEVYGRAYPVIGTDVHHVMQNIADLIVSIGVGNLGDRAGDPKVRLNGWEAR